MRGKKVLYQVAFVLVSVVFVVIFVARFGELSQAFRALTRGSWYFLLAAVAVQGIGIINRGAFYHSLYDYFGVREPLRRLIMLSLTASFVNLAAPSGGLSGIAVFVSEAQRQGMSKSRSLFVNFFAHFLIYGLFILILLFGLFYLMFNHQLHHYQVATAAVLFGMIFVLVALFFAAVGGAAKVRKLLGYITKAINFFAGLLSKRAAGRGLIGHSKVKVISEEVALCLNRIKEDWRGVCLPGAHVFLMEIIDILTLYYLFLAFKYPIYPGVLITAYAIGFLFAFVSITPNGIGIVEATMIVVLAGLGVPVEIAVVATLGYRILTFWLPFVLGYFAFRFFKKNKLIELANGSA